MDLLEKKALFNTTRYFTKSKPTIVKGDEVFGSFGDVGISSRYSFFQRLFSELRIRFDNNQNRFIILFIFFGRCYKQALKNLKF